MPKEDWPMYIREFFKKAGSLGGKRRVKTTTPEQRSEWAKKAAAASARVRSRKAKAKRAARKPEWSDSH
jgi:uncharacterized protein YdaU (DUF1376 family)